jgi:hypothetical protein
MQWVVEEGDKAQHVAAACRIRHFILLQGKVPCPECSILVQLEVCMQVQHKTCRALVVLLSCKPNCSCPLQLLMCSKGRCLAHPFISIHLLILCA